MSRCRSGKLSPRLFPVFVWWISSSELWMKTGIPAAALVSRLRSFEVTKNTSGWTPEVSNAGKTDHPRPRSEHTVGKWQDIVTTLLFLDGSYPCGARRHWKTRLILWTRSNMCDQDSVPRPSFSSSSVRASFRSANNVLYRSYAHDTLQICGSLAGGAHGLEDSRFCVGTN